MLPVQRFAIAGIAAASLFVHLLFPSDAEARGRGRRGMSAAQIQRMIQNMPMPQLKQFTVEYEFVIVDEGLVRTMHILNPELDDKGHIKILSVPEKEKLKGETAAERKLTGYKAETEDLQVGDIVVVTLSRWKPVKPKEKEQESLDPNKKKDAKDSDDAEDKKDDKKTEKEEKKTEKKEKMDDKAAAVSALSDEDHADHDRIAGLKNWKPWTRMLGIIKRVDAGSRRMTIAVQQQQQVMASMNQMKAYQKTQAKAKPGHQAIDPASLQASFVIIMRRTQPNAGNVGNGGFSFGKTK